MTRPQALIVDDEPDIRELLEMTLSRMAIDCATAADIQAAKKLLQRRTFQLCLTDMKLPDGNGIDLVKYIQTRYPTLPTAVITAHGNMESAVNALKAGAYDFVSKPVDLQVLRNLVTTALKLSGPIELTDGGAAAVNMPALLGDSAIMQQTRAKISKLARSQAPVYISGESGTGKELVARLIHLQGPRAEQAFIPVNCGAIPADLMESEFFGHKKGSFTGAIFDKAGLFQAASGGTLFLDEVADLPLPMQVKLLRAIQEKAVRPIGAAQEVPIDVRILSATHKNLAQLVQNGSFRQDLFYRINVIELQVPPLRQRAGDIPLLAQHFLQQLAQQNHCPPVVLDEAALQALCDYSFPGNVRELENILERAMTLCENQIIRSQDLQLLAPQTNAASATIEATAASKPPPGMTPAAMTPTLLEPTSPATSAEVLGDKHKLEGFLDNTEKNAILTALEQTRYNKTKAAQLLGITFRALRYRLKKYNIG